MSSRGYNDLLSFEEFKENCDSIDVAVHFLYNDPNTDRDLSRWYKISDDTIQTVYAKTKSMG